MMSRNKFNNKYSKLESNEQTQKYVKEMYEMADKTERRSNIAFTAIVIPIALILVLTIIQIVSFTTNLAKDDANPSNLQIVSNNTSSKEATAENSEDGNSNNNITHESNSSSDKIYNYLKDKNNRKSSLDNAVKLNNGKEKGLSSIFIAQILRDNGYSIDKSVINTDRLIEALEKDGWKKISDYKQLKSGDVCFTSNSKSGSPSHTYIFMDWLKEGKTDYGHIVDSQISEYDDTYHERNISISTPKKDKFNFLMRKE